MNGSGPTEPKLFRSGPPGELVRRDEKAALSILSHCLEFWLVCLLVLMILLVYVRPAKLWTRAYHYRLGERKWVRES
jgi:hypothetical protein